MKVLLILLLVLLAIAGVLLVAPLELLLSSDRGVYRLAYRGLADAALLRTPEGGWDVRIWVLGWRKRWDLWDLLTTPRKKAVEEEKITVKKKTVKKKNKRKTPRHLFRRLRNVWRALEVRRFWIELDTDDFILNAYLYPLFTVLGGRRKSLEINFEGRTAIEVDIIGRPWKLLWAFLKVR